ncbi:MAG: isoprenylcysteine carboxylmethyltransferase family protein [Acidobacteria bacterium]|nr:isoprenylcysteine carboxylmethyltransferase family protein [Acidobacteriota bacterium]
MALPWKDVPKLLLPAVILWSAWFAAWGFDDLEGFFAHPARVGVIGVLVTGVVLMLIWRPEVKPFRKGYLGAGLEKWIAAALMAIVVAFAVFLPYGDRRGYLVFAESGVVRYVGLALHTIAVAIRLVGLRTLDIACATQQGDQLVQTGLYSVIRHPLYLGGALAWLGLVMVFRSWLVIPFLAIAVVFMRVRIGQEEKLLAEQFGAEFEAYRRRTWRLIPYVY